MIWLLRVGWARCNAWAAREMFPSRATIQKELQLGTLVSVRLDPTPERPFSFVHQKQKFRLRLMETLLEFARDYCDSHDSSETP